MPVKIGTPRGAGGLTDEVRRPRFATAAGLVQYGQAREGKCAPLVEPKPRRGKGIRRIYRMKSWLKAVVNQF